MDGSPVWTGRPWYTLRVSIDIKLIRALRNKVLGEPRTELYQSSAKAPHEALHEALYRASVVEPS